MGGTLFEQLEEGNKAAVVCLKHQYRMNRSAGTSYSRTFAYNCDTSSFYSNPIPIMLTEEINRKYEECDNRSYLF